MKTIGIIPARYNSSRFPGKVLCDILGKPMIWYTYNSAKQWNGFDSLYVATEDDVVFKECKNYNMPCLMTSDKHIDCLDRASEAMKVISSAGDDLCVIIQGDEPLFDYTILNSIKDDYDKVNNFYTVSRTDINDSDAVKVVMDNFNNALYFSRHSIPFRKNRTRRDKNIDVKVYKQLGIYAIVYGYLQKYNKLGMSYLESIEGIGMLRFLENNIPVKMIYTDKDSISVDTEKDRQTIIKIMESK